MAPQNSYEAIRTVAEAFRNNPNDPQQGIFTLSYAGDAGIIDYNGTRAGNRAKPTLLTVKNGSIIVVND
jgi:hypothetical protein